MSENKTISTITTVLVVIILLSSVASFVNINNLTSKTKDLDSKIEELSAINTELTSAVSSLSDSVANLADTIGATSEDITDIKDRLSELEKEEKPKEVTLVIGLNRDVPSVDPGYLMSDALGQIDQMVHLPLVLLRESSDGEPYYEPGLAKSFEQVDDTTWLIHLREGVKWSDGSDFSAKDVIFTFTREPFPGDLAWWTESVIESMTEVDENTVKLVTPTPVPRVFKWFYHGNVLSVKAAEDSDQLHGAPIVGVENLPGTGPFMYSSLEPGIGLELLPNPYYFGDSPDFTQVKVTVILDDIARVNALQTGLIDVTYPIPGELIEQLEGADIRVYTKPGSRVGYLNFNHLKEPFSDETLRKAVAYALDYDTIIEQLYGSAYERSYSPVAPGALGYKAFPIYDYNPSKAKELLSDAGVPNGFTCKFYIPSTGSVVKNRELAEAIAGYLDQVGIRAQIEMVEWSTYIVSLIDDTQAVKDGTLDYPDWDLCFWGWSTDTFEAADDLNSIFGVGSYNFWGYSNPDVENYITIAIGDAPEAEKVAASEAALEIMMEECATVPLYVNPFTTGLTPDWKGLVIAPNGYNVFTEIETVP